MSAASHIFDPTTTIKKAQLMKNRRGRKRFPVMVAAIADSPAPTINMPANSDKPHKNSSSPSFICHPRFPQRWARRRAPRRAGGRGSAWMQAGVRRYTGRPSPGEVDAVHGKAVDGVALVDAHKPVRIDAPQQADHAFPPGDAVIAQVGGDVFPVCLKVEDLTLVEQAHQRANSDLQGRGRLARPDHLREVCYGLV